MARRRSEIWLERITHLLAPRYWRRWWLLLWIGTAAALIALRWGAIHWFALGDTDDNLRIAQVRALLEGQGWYDLRQYRLDPPAGANIHWTRLVDLPIAAIILVTKPFLGGFGAEKAAAAIAPLLAFGPALYALCLAVRRLIGENIGILLLAFCVLFAAANPMAMFAPLRIDHHGWQLAMLMLAVAGSADRNRARGGVTVGIATAVSFSIGLEMLPSMAIAGALIVLRWISDGAEAPRLRAYAASLAGGCAIGFLLFASNDNRAFVCDAFSPVYLSTMLLAGALLFALALLPIADRRLRFAAALTAGAALAAFFALAWPHCLGRPEGLSPELKRLWFDNIREVKPLYRQNWRIAVTIATIPVIGVTGALIALWRARATDRAAGWAAAAVLALFSTTALLWQTRYSPSAQLLAVPGATALGWWLWTALVRQRWWVQGIGLAAVVALVTGSLTDGALWITPQQQRTETRKKIDRANRFCPTLPALAPIAKLPAATILTFVDLGPRLIAVTHHSALAGPYHRNGAAILDVQHAFRSADPETAHEIMRRHGATLLLTCPGLSESTIYASQNPKGFYMQLQRGKIPAWLEPVKLPASSPFRLWRLVH